MGSLTNNLSPEQHDHLLAITNGKITSLKSGGAMDLIAQLFGIQRTIGETDQEFTDRIASGMIKQIDDLKKLFP